ncbi:hypothetical protein [Mesorhizobium sp. STM 4661]|uniref:hypothetical protein n=1 Tax=Mesorhizobium sp. STM 4661 TaxID=1297570 RepID=UPI0002BD82D2|nr:hypothetical protein [Mesorhizobium sp. STM 4661]CCV11600.1 hypothetical protein MESS4_330149 [Mesorhizobium sp. STM 4661]
MFVDIRRVDDVISFDPEVLSLTIAPGSPEVVVFRNNDRKAGHWIMPVGRSEDQWFPEPLARCTDPDFPPVSSHLILTSDDGPKEYPYTCSKHPHRDPAEGGSIKVNMP